MDLSTAFFRASESKNTALPPPPATPACTATSAGQASSIQQHAIDPDIALTTHDSDGPEEDKGAAQRDRDPLSDESFLPTKKIGSNDQPILKQWRRGTDLRE
jgi:hypothetical protein